MLPWHSGIWRREHSKKTVPRVLPVSPTTKTCRRMYSHTVITTPPPLAGAPSTPTGYSDGINQRLWLSYLCVVSIKIGVFYVAIDTGLWV